MSEAPTTNVPAVREQHSLKEVEIVQRGTSAHLMPQSMADVVRFADVMSRGEISLPKHLRGKPGDCLTVTLQALDWGMNPISVANKTYSVNDRLAYEAQLVSAVVQARAPIVGLPRYEYAGDPKTTRRCTVTVTTTDGETPSYTSPPVKDITVKNSPLWKTDEDQQLGYYSIRALARRYFPGVLLGVYTPDETAEMRDVTPRHRETTGLRERLESAKMAPTDDRGFSKAGVEEVIDGHFESVVDPETGEVIEAAVLVPTEALEAVAAVQEAVQEATGLPDALRAASEPEGDWLKGPVGDDPRAIAAWIERFKTRCGNAETASEMIATRADFMESHIRPLYETAPQRVEELDAWFAEALKAKRKGAK